MNIKNSSDLREIQTDTDTQMTLQVCPTMIQKGKGVEVLGDYTIGLNLYQETGADDDGEMFTALTARQARTLIEQLSAMTDKVERLNAIVNG